MAYYRTRSIVLKSRNLGEADRVLVIFSEDYGKFEAVVKGARRPRSRFIGNTLPFNLINGLFFPGKNMYQLSQAELIHSFSVLREDLTKLAYASNWAELVNELVPEREEVSELFRFLLAAFITLEQTQQPLIVHLAFLIRLLNYLGYNPELDCCLGCNATSSDHWYFSVAAGGIVCPNCCGQYRDQHVIPVAEIDFLKYLLTTDLRKLEPDVHEVRLSSVHQKLRDFIEARLDHPLKSQLFLDNLLG
ncbi:MAG TPA: DNA repair protein RecO [Bacillota bacterium]|jgi:DNA repair protein RecO (recombination protein O)|nr:DNA repair protein RecO [Bacillota bacterium]HOL09191.1 DNA repair protein RecO [Bacillota bacterium]HPO97015.1 DNA repair protein RecO [Bacillota bacterium]